MGWTYGPNSMGSTSRTTWAATIFVMAAMVLLLWFGSLRSEDTVSAHLVSPRSDAHPIQTGAEIGDEGLFTCRLGIPCLATPNSAVGEPQEIENGAHSILNIEGASFTSGGQEDERCLLVGIPCFTSSSVGYTGQPGGGIGAGILLTQ